MGKKERKEKEKFAEVLIPMSLFNKIEERIKGTGFSSVSSYVTYVLKEVLSEEEVETFTKEDEEKIKARLRALGYID
jgi:Arc/MetJ-type ribon-helix-helix transcriptional regulator